MHVRTYIRIYTYSGNDHVISEHDRVQTKDDMQEYKQDNDDDQPPRKRRRYVCMYVRTCTVQCKNVVIVSRQVREPLHNSLCRRFSTKQSRITAHICDSLVQPTIINSPFWLLM